MSVHPAIILASLGTLAVFAGDYLRKAWHEITQDTPDDDPYGDWPQLPPEAR